MGRVTGLKAPEQKLSDGITPSVVEGFASDVWIGGVDSRIYAPNNPMLAGPRESSTNSCCKDSLAVIVEKEYQSVSKQINNHAFSSSPSISCTILGTFLKIQNINENDLAKLELLVPSYQNYGINFIISLAAVKVVLIDLTPNADVRVAGLNQIMNNYIQYNEARHELPIGKFKPFTYDVNDSKFNKSVPEITDTLSEVDVHCLTTYGHVKNYDIVLSFSNESSAFDPESVRGQRGFLKGAGEEFSQSLCYANSAIEKPDVQHYDPGVRPEEQGWGARPPLDSFRILNHVVGGPFGCDVDRPQQVQTRTGIDQEYSRLSGLPYNAFARLPDPQNWAGDTLVRPNLFGLRVNSFLK